MTSSRETTKISLRELIEMAELPGNIHEKIGDLRIERGLTKKQVSEDLGIPASQLTRIENEDIKSIGHELILKFADYFGVSTDYLLGRTTVRSQKNIELDELGLSNKALITLLSGKVNTELLSRIIEHSNFIPLMGYAEAYFESAHEEGFLSRNNVIDLATGDLTELLKENPSQKTEITNELRHLNAQKISGTEADLEKLKATFLKIMRDVKKEYGESKEDVAAEEMRNQVKQLHQEALKHKGHMTEAKMAELTAKMLLPAGIDGENRKSFEKLMENILKDSNKKRRK